MGQKHFESHVQNFTELVNCPQIVWTSIRLFLSVVELAAGCIVKRSQMHADHLKQLDQLSQGMIKRATAKRLAVVISVQEIHVGFHLNQNILKIEHFE